MVRPLSLGSTVVTAAVFLLARSAAAEELPFACEAGIVLGGADAMDVVARGCEVARAKTTSGRVRIGVVATGSRVLVTATRVADASGVEQTARADTGSIDEAMRTVPRVVDAVLPKSAQPPMMTVPPALAAPSAPPLPAQPPPPEPEPAAPPRTVRVDVDADKGFRLLQSRDGTGTWEPACEGSCRGLELPLDASYRVVDSRGHAVKGFRLDPNGADRMALHISGRSMALDVVAVAGIVAGGALFFGGVGGQNSSVTWLGLLSGTLGIAGVALNGTSVVQHPLDQVEPAPRPQPLPRDAHALGGTIVSIRF